MLSRQELQTTQEAYGNKSIPWVWNWVMWLGNWEMQQ